MNIHEFSYIYGLLKNKYGTQQAIAEALGIDRTYVSKLKNGEHITNELASKLQKLAGVQLPSNTQGIPDHLIQWVIK